MRALEPLCSLPQVRLQPAHITSGTAATVRSQLHIKENTLLSLAAEKVLLHSCGEKLIHNQLIKYNY